MKRIGAILVSVLLLLSFTGCSEEDIKIGIGNIVTGIGRLAGHKYDYEIMNDTCKELTDAICRRDRSALKALFSEKALEEAENFDENMTKLFDFFRGEVVSYYDPCGGPSMDGRMDSGKVEKVFMSNFNVETTEAKYHIDMHKTERNDWHPDEVGIYFIWIEKTNEFYDDMTDWPERGGEWPAGININS